MLKGAGQNVVRSVGRRLAGSVSSSASASASSAVSSHLPMGWSPTTATTAARSMASFASRTLPALEQIDVKVPTMGDSITEGTIVEWTAQIGQLVKEGDVVALVETDKVTVDIKAEMDGVVVEHFGEVDDNVEVGAPLYKIDTEATEAPGGFFEVAAAGDDDEAEEGAESVSGEGVAAAKDGSSSGGHVRVPSIHFLGKVGWSKKLSAPVRDAAADIAAGVPPAVGGPAPTSVSADLGPMYGRPAISAKEMEALILGGAEEAPNMKSPSGPALFGF